MGNYLNELNEVQREAVVGITGPSLVIAGAGSGKTRVLTYRIAHMLNQDIKPWNILALTFTNKAAKEMKERIAKLIGEEKAKPLWMGTFHSIFAKILRKESALIKYPSSFTIYDASDSKNLVKTIIKELGLNDQIYKPNVVLNRISTAKNNLVTCKSYVQNDIIRQTDAAARQPEIWKVYEVYAQRCFKSGVMDFDDLLLQTNVLFRDYPDTLAKYQQQFKYILVDEYQDTNFAQYLIVKKLSAMHQNLCVVGDDAQSIYSFRGAKIENILNFRNDFPNYNLFKLEQNYRSTQNIVEAANSLIKKNLKQIKKNVFSENERGNKLKVIEAKSDIEEGVIIANSINDRRLTFHDDYKNFAILYRTNAQSRIFEEALRKRNIPYKIYGGMSFYQRKEIKDVLAYCRIVANPSDNEALKRIINYPKRGIGDTTIEKLELYANSKEITLWQVIVRPINIEAGIQAGTQKKIAEFVKLIDYYQRIKNQADAYSLVSGLVNNSGILKELALDKTQESISRHENIQELLNGIKEFSEQKDIEQSELTLEKYLEEVSLLTTDDNDKDTDIDRIALMTIHSSKGLEFKNVYIVGLEEDLFPNKITASSEKELEEERRLFYVAITRAEKELTLSYARERHKWGEFTICTPSRFIKEIEPQYLDGNVEPTDDNTAQFIEESGFNYDFKLKTNQKIPQKLTPIKKIVAPGLKKEDALLNKIQPKPLLNYSKVTNSTNSETTDNQDSIDNIKIGTRVEHLRFGFGKVISIEGDSPNIKATIEFDISGKKTLLLKYAKLNIIA